MKACKHCHSSLVGLRPHAQYCSGTCRAAAHRVRGAERELDLTKTIVVQARRKALLDADEDAFAAATEALTALEARRDTLKATPRVTK